jgi:hypothetical protein
MTTPPHFPRLDPAMQADRLVAPVTRWGSVGRTSVMTGTYHFMTDDFRFATIERRAHLVPDSGCRVAAEVNFSTWPGMDRGAALRTIWRKRRLAACWQSRGVRILVDANVAPGLRDVALLGVPAGWRAYATRSHSDYGVEELEREFAWLAGHAGTEDILYVVVGGGRRRGAECAERGWTWVPEEAHVAAGRQRAYGGADG